MDTTIKYYNPQRQNESGIGTKPSWSMFFTRPVHILKQIKNKQILTWPGLDANIVSKNIPTCAMTTLKGHMKQEIKHIQYTKKQPPPHTINAAQEEK